MNDIWKLMTESYRLADGPWSYCLEYMDRDEVAIFNKPGDLLTKDPNSLTVLNNDIVIYGDSWILKKWTDDAAKKNVNFPWNYMIKPISNITYKDYNGE